MLDKEAACAKKINLEIQLSRTQDIRQKYICNYISWIFRRKKIYIYILILFSTFSLFELTNYFCYKWNAFVAHRCWAMEGKEVLNIESEPLASKQECRSHSTLHFLERQRWSDLCLKGGEYRRSSSIQKFKFEEYGKYIFERIHDGKNILHGFARIN